MLDDNEIEAIAQDYVFKRYPADCGILSRDQRPDGIHFEVNSRSDNLLDQYVGLGSFIVSRESGAIREISCCRTVDEREAERIRERSLALIKEWVDQVRRQ